MILYCVSHSIRQQIADLQVNCDRVKLLAGHFFKNTLQKFPNTLLVAFTH